MAIQKIEANVVCDGCGKQFRVELPLDVPLDDFVDLEDICREYVAWGEGYILVDTFPLDNHVSIAEGDTPNHWLMHLCDDCTRIIDKKLGGAIESTKDQVMEALGLVEI